MIRAVAGAVDVQGMRIDKTRRTLQVSNLRVFQIGGVPVIDVPDITLAGSDQFGPVESVDLDIETVASRIVQHMRHAGGVPHNLLRHAADVDAGAAQLVVFDHGAFGAILRGPFRRR